ncbi:MAG: hypothetical protein WAL45_02885 [Terracidiphilus sp.]
MKRITIALAALLFALCSAAAHANTVETAYSCVSVTSSSNSTVIHNNCSQPIQVELRYSDGNDELMEMTGSSQQADDDANADVKPFACYSPSTPSSDPNNFVTPVYATTHYWCMKP